MRFRPLRIDYHTEASNLLRDESNKEESTKIWISGAHHDEDAVVEEQLLGDCEGVSQTKDGISKNTAEIKAREMGSTTNPDGKSEQSSRRSDDDFSPYEDSSEDSGDAMEFDYGDEHDKYKSANDLLHERTCRNRKTAPTTGTKQRYATTNLDSAITIDLSHQSIQSSRRQLSPADVIEEATPKAQLPPKQLRHHDNREMKPDSTNDNKSQQTRASYYYIPWLLSFISNIQRVVNRKRISMVSCENPICLVSTRPANPFDSAWVCNTEWWWVIGTSTAFNETIYRRTDRRLNSIRNTLEYASGPESTCPKLPKDLKIGKFSGNALGSRANRREAFRRDLKALVVYKGNPTEKETSDDIKPDMLQKAWEAAATIAYSVAEKACNVGATSRCDDSGERKRTAPPSSVGLTYSPRPDGPYQEAADAFSERLSNDPLICSEQTQYVRESNADAADHDITTRSNAEASRMTRSKRLSSGGDDDLLQDSTTTRPSRKKRRKKHSNEHLPAELYANGHSQKETRPRQEPAPRSRTNQVQRREELIREKESSLLERFGLHVKSNSPVKVCTTHTDEETKARLCKSTTSLAGLVPLQDTKNHLHLQNETKLPAKSSRGRISKPYQSQVQRQKFRRADHNHQVPSSHSIPRDGDDIHQNLTIRAKLAAPPLRCGSPSSFDRKLKRQSTTKNDEHRRESIWTTSCQERNGTVDILRNKSSHDSPPLASKFKKPAASIASKPPESLFELLEEDSESSPLRYCCEGRHDESIEHGATSQEEMPVYKSRTAASASRNLVAELKMQSLQAPSTAETTPPRRATQEMTLHNLPVVSLDRGDRTEILNCNIASTDNSAKIHRTSQLHEFQGERPDGNGATSHISIASQSNHAVHAPSRHNEIPIPSTMEETAKSHNMLSQRYKQRGSTPKEMARIYWQDEGNLKVERKRLRKEEKKQRRREKKRLKKERKRQERSKQGEGIKIIQPTGASNGPSIGGTPSKYDLDKFTTPPIVSKDKASTGNAKPPAEVKTNMIGRNDKPSDSIEVIDVDEQPYGPQPPVSQLLCSEAFIETWGEVVAALASGYWDNNGTIGDGVQTADFLDVPTQPCHKIQLLDTNLIDSCGVDIELGGREAIIVSSASRWKEAGAAPLLKQVIDLALTSRYKFLEVLVCVDTDFNEFLSNEISRLQNGFLRQRANPPTAVNLRLVSPDSLCCCIGQMAIKTGYSKEYFKMVETVISDKRATERILFLISVAPSLSIGGALKSLELLQSRDNAHDMSRYWFRHMVGKVDRERRRLQALVRSSNDVRGALNPESMIQLSFAINLALGKRQGAPK